MHTLYNNITLSFSFLKWPKEKQLLGPFGEELNRIWMRATRVVRIYPDYRRVRTKTVFVGESGGLEFKPMHKVADL